MLDGVTAMIENLTETEENGDWHQKFLVLPVSSPTPPAVLQLEKALWCTPRPPLADTPAVQRLLWPGGLLNKRFHVFFVIL